MSKKGKRVEKREKGKGFYKLIVIAVLLCMVYFILKNVPNYINTDITNKTNLVINNSNVTASLKKDVIIENGFIYVAMEDAQNFFDSYIYYDEKYNQIITTSNNQVASIVIGENVMTNNGTDVKISSTVIKKDETIYIPLTSLKNVYNMDILYIEATNTVVADSKDRKMVIATSKKKNDVKVYPTTFSRTVDTLEEKENVVVVNTTNGWTKIRTDAGKIGYVKEKTLVNEFTQRETIEEKKQITNKISMVWDYYSEYYSAPDRTGENIEGINVVSPTFFTLVDEGKGEIYDNAQNEGL